MAADEATLARLMAQAQRGDRAAYRELLGECDLWLRRFYGRKAHPDTLEDLVQETLISLHRKRASWDSDRAFLPWLAAIARYRWLDHLRRVYRAPEAELAVEPAVESEEDAVGARLGVDRLLGTIPEAQALAIRLTKIEGLSVAEASARSGQSESAVKVNVHRGLKRMAALIEEGT